MSQGKEQHGVILQHGVYVSYLVLGTKDDGKIVMFPPLDVPVEDVLGCFESAAEAQLFIVTQKLEQAVKDLAAEKQAHETTKNRARLLLHALGSFEGAL